MMAARGDQVEVLQLRQKFRPLIRGRDKDLAKHGAMVQIFTGYGTFVLLRAMAKLPVLVWIAAVRSVS